MTKYTTLLSMISLAMTIIPTSASLGFPTNVNFVTHLYNTSNCSNTSSIRNISLHHFCYDTHIVNGHPTCCNDLLNEVSLFENVSFGQCVGFNMTILNNTLTNITNMTNLTGLEYSCNIARVNQFTTVEALSYIGLFSMCLLAILLVGGIMYFICSCGRKGVYNRI
jgi:hypothetical protein